MATGDPIKSRGGGWGEVKLQYPGKKERKAVLQMPPATLIPVQNDHPLGTNTFILGENLSVLAALARHSDVQHKVNLVYIDPPYSTETSFKTRDSVRAYDDALTGSAYLAFMWDRLVLIHELMADGGSLYVHIDQKALFHLKIMLDEIFGLDGFRNCITRKKCNPKNYTRKQYGNITDYILFYVKGSGETWNRATEQRGASSEKEYAYTEPGTGRRFMKVPLHAPGVRRGATGQPWRGMSPPPGKHWQYTPETLEQMDSRGEIYWSGNGNPRRKIYLDERDGVPVQDIWLEFKDAHNQNIRITGYPTEKPEALLERIISASSNPGDLVLDAFAGSGTTLDVASRLGRRWIGIDDSAVALKAVKYRFGSGLSRMGDYVSARNGAEQLSLLEPTLSSLAGANERKVRPVNLWSTQEKLLSAVQLLNEVEAA